MRSLLRILATGVAATLAVSLASAVPAQADPVPGDQPLPGYTINNPPLSPILIGGWLCPCRRCIGSIAGDREMSWPVG